MRVAAHNPTSNSKMTRHENEDNNFILEILCPYTSETVQDNSARENWAIHHLSHKMK
jgi:hypothetical protein